jgi:pimeloyl-ACP methyl ester carboxylesterase
MVLNTFGAVGPSHSQEAGKSGRPPLSLALPCVLLCFILLGCVLAVEKIPQGRIIAPTVRDHFVKVGSLRYHYTEYPGAGRDIVFLHGFASSTYSWDKVAPVLNRLGYHIFALDMKGFGWSDKPAGAAYDPLTLTREVNQWMEAMGLRKVVLCGNSLGGGISTLIAILHPERAERVILIDAAAYNTKYPLIMKMANLPLSGEASKLFFSRWVVRQTLSEVYYHRDWITEDQVDAYYDRSRTENGLEAQIAVVRAMKFSQVERYVNRIPEIKARTLIIWGREDRWIPLSSAYRFNREIRGSSLVVIPACGHMPQEERPDVTAWLIDTFVRDKSLKDV